MNPFKIIGKIENLYRLWGEVTDWDRGIAINSYLKYHDISYACAYHFGFEGYVGAALFAALSPNNDFHGNLRDMKNMLAAAQAGLDITQFRVSTYGNNKRKAWSIVKGSDPLKLIVAQKTRSFYKNINNPLDPEPVTVDGHMVNMWRGERVRLVGLRGITPRVYEQVAQGVREMARGVGLIPNQVQACLWQTWRRIHKIQTSPQGVLWDIEFQKAGLGFKQPYEKNTKTAVSSREDNPVNGQGPHRAREHAMGDDLLRESRVDAQACWVGSIDAAPNRATFS
jgi:hypothetical protein